MSFLIRYRLFRLARRSHPSSLFLTNLEKTLFPQKEINHLHYVRALRYGVVPALLIVGLLTGTGTYAYASDRVLPDHFLYPLRQSVEGVEFQLASVTGLKDRVRLKQLERRAREKKMLQEKRTTSVIKKDPQEIKKEEKKEAKKEVKPVGKPSVIPTPVPKAKVKK